MKWSVDRLDATHKLVIVWNVTFELAFNKQHQRFSFFWLNKSNFYRSESNVMYTGQLYPALYFWKDLIPDAVKYWFSVTSVKALIILLRLNNFSNKIFFAFLGFHKWSHTHTFLPHCRVFVHAFLLPHPMDVAAVIPNRILEIDLPTFPLITFIIRGKSWKMKGLPEPVGRIAKTS